MLRRGRSKDRARKVTPPGPSYMSNEQFAEYLSDLRNNRVARPGGARPQPSRGRRESDRGFSISTQTNDPIETLPSDSAPRSASVLSHRRAQTSVSTYSSVTSRTGRPLAQQPSPGVSARDFSQGPPLVLLKPSEVVASATYIERGQRWMEKEEAVSLREAMQDMDLQNEDEEEMRIHVAAQDEASELVWQHQHPAARNPDTSYRYREHLRKNSYARARSQSVGHYGGSGIATGLARDIAPRSVSGSSNSSGGMHSQRSRVSSASSDQSQLGRTVTTDAMTRTTFESTLPALTSATRKSYGSISSSSRPQSSRRRSSARRNISGETAGTFTGEQIWEEPEQEDLDRGRSPKLLDMPEPLRIKARNPLNRVQFAQGPPLNASSISPEPVKKISKTEIHRNPPSQSRNPHYTSNPVSRSQPLNSNTAPESEPMTGKTMKDGLETRSDEIRQATSMLLKDRSPKLPTPSFVSDKPGRPIVSFDSNWKPKEADKTGEEPRKSRYESPSEGQRHSIHAQPDQKGFTTPIPTIQLPDTPSIQVNHAPKIPIPNINIPDSSSSVPSICFPDEPAISAPIVPSIDVSGSSISDQKRPLPDPRISSSRPGPRHHAAEALTKRHWSPAVGNRATATCHQCQLPIEGRVVAIRGVQERFHPQCFICYSCGTGLEALEISPEPPAKRAERLDRIQRREAGEHVEEIEGQTMAEDGDERLRFYCHLDWHEHFAPKCKHCKTPIIGEHVVALGEHWHYGHFFCAECGDPFEQGMTHIEKDGYAWCLNCQTKRTERQAPKCKKCRRPVIGHYVEALGGEWHSECFRCATCNGGFEDGQIFPREDGEETIVLCTKCMERELKA